jgi:hypothetical protein
MSVTVPLVNGGTQWQITMMPPVMARVFLGDFFKLRKLLGTTASIPIHIEP